MDGGEMVDIPWHVARFLSDEAKGVQKKNKIMRAHLIGRIARHFKLVSTSALRFNGLRQVEIVDEILDDSDAEAEA
ncbi:hypothetical protein Tco_1072763, partial [Tanacetum coccineum]